MQTSNTVFITAPKLGRSEEEGFDGKSYVNAIGTCASTLELVPATGSALPFLKKSLPIRRLAYDDVEMEDALEDVNEFDLLRAKQAILADIPFSDEECESAWTHLCPIYRQGRWWRPEAALLLKVWQHILQEAKDVNANFASVSPIASLPSAIMGLEDLQAAVAQSILQHISHGAGGSERSRCVRFVGSWVLESSGEIPTSKFLQSWRQSLPELWQADADVELLKDCITRPTTRSVLLKDPDAVQPEAAAAGSVGGKRKWHEKFKKGRA